MDPTPVSWHKVAKTGAIDGLIEVAPLIGHILSILYFDFWIDSVATFDFYLGVYLEVGGSCTLRVTTDPEA